MNCRIVFSFFTICSGVVFGASTPGSLATGDRAITKPSADVILSFVQPGRIEEILFKNGDGVKAGDLVMRLDDRAEKAQLASLWAQSQDRTQILASEASLAQKQVDLKKLEKAASVHAATELEVEHARLDVTVAELSKALAEFEHEQDGRKYQEALIRTDQMRLHAPITGTIEEVLVEAGESVNTLQEAVRIVQTDPLSIDASLPITRAATLKRGDVVKVAFPDPRAGSHEGKVIAVGTVADAASSTLTVRIEVPNPGRRPAGEHVQVFCPPTQ